MKNLKKLLGIVVIGTVIVIGTVGCATVSSIGGTVDTHGLISKATTVSVGAQEIASYGVILGLLDTGYEAYTTAVQQAETEGKMVTTVTTQYFGFFTKITAYAK